MRKKSENRSNIIKPLHFGHSIDPSPVFTFTAGGVAKQELHQFVVFHYFNELWVTYLTQGQNRPSHLVQKRPCCHLFVPRRGLHDWQRGGEGNYVLA
jgi:hypothetical protein